MTAQMLKHLGLSSLYLLRFAFVVCLFKKEVGGGSREECVAAGASPSPLDSPQTQKKSALAYFYVFPLHVLFVLFVVVCVLLSRG